jgi:hypothetical protein
VIRIGQSSLEGSVAATSIALTDEDRAKIAGRGLHIV